MSVTEAEQLQSGESEVVALIKAAPQVGYKHGETVCCAGIDLHGHWLRLFPVSFRNLDDGQKFGRWDRIRFRWRRPADDLRSESRRVDQRSLAIVGKLKPAERQNFLAKSIVTGLEKERQAQRSLALLKPVVRAFKIEAKPADQLLAEHDKFEELRKQQDLFATTPLVPYEPCPFIFKYKYFTDDGEREGTCQDWEIEATFFNWRLHYGEAHALAEMQRVFGQQYPENGMLLAMGTHSRYPDVWLINGVIRLDDILQMSML